MDAALMFLALIWGLLGGKSTSAPSRTPERLPPSNPGQVTSTPPWPQVVPSGLPPFPGPGWEFDEPPPAAVQQRAAALVNQLWARGSGTFKIEQTAGRWIAYRAEVVASGKKGVVAFRQKRAAPPPAPSRSVARTVARAPARAPAPARPPAPAAARPSTATPTSSPAPTPWPAGPDNLGVHPLPAPPLLQTLRYGMGLRPSNPVHDVRTLQQRLRIEADGRFGVGTRTAVEIFQRSHGLEVDGVVGPKTWAALLAQRA
jgi:hypothetical protein